MLKRFIAYYKPHKLMFTLDMIAALFTSLIGMVYPVVTNKMLNDLIPNRQYRQIVIAGIIVWRKQKTPHLFLSAFLMFLFSGLGAAVMALMFYISMYGELLMALFLYFYAVHKEKHT